MTEPAPGVSGEALAEPAHLGSCVSCPELLGVRPGIEGGGGGGESACECPVGHDERVVAPAVQTNRHAGQLSPHGEHVVSGKVLAVIEGAVSGVAGTFVPMTAPETFKTVQKDAMRKNAGLDFIAGRDACALRGVSRNDHA